MNAESDLLRPVIPQKEYIYPIRRLNSPLQSFHGRNRANYKFAFLRSLVSAVKINKYVGIEDLFFLVSNRLYFLLVIIILQNSKESEPHKELCSGWSISPPHWTGRSPLPTSFPSQHASEVRNRSRLGLRCAKVFKPSCTDCDLGVQKSLV
jgi:hypothetical protein